MTFQRDPIPQTVQVRIEVTRGSRIKRSAAGGIDFISPLPCPWNYGSAVDHLGEDGEPVDVVVMGPAIERGSTRTVVLQGHIPFTDLGAIDDKWIAHTEPLTVAQIEQVESFFRRYAQAKRLAARLRSKPGPIQAGPYTPWRGSEHPESPLV